MDARPQPKQVLDSVVIPAKRAFGQGVWTHPPMVLLAMIRERDKSVDLLLGIGGLPSSSCESLYIVPGVLFLSVMVRRYFMLS